MDTIPSRITTDAFVDFHFIASIIFLMSFSTPHPLVLRIRRNHKSLATLMNSKKKAMLDCVKHLELAICKGRQYLETGQHAQWHGFRPLFVPKVVGGKVLPPHKDWIKNVFLPRSERALMRAEERLEILTVKMAIAGD